MKITVEVSELNESTSYPWWTIIDPDQMMSPGCHKVASMITGPFFSRKSAEEFLSRTRYNFSKRAVVYCHSGCYSDEYIKSMKEASK